MQQLQIENVLRDSLTQLHTLADNDPRAGTLLNNMAVAYQAAGRFSEADSFYKRSLARWERTLPGKHSWIAQSLNNRASLYREMEEYPEAERIFQDALSIWRSTGWPFPSHPTTVIPGEPSTPSGHEPMWSETPLLSDGHVLPRYRRMVQALKKGVQEGDAESVSNLHHTLGKLGPWYHNVDLGFGIFTEPSRGNYPNAYWNLLRQFISEDLSGKTVLDIGCTSGFLCFKVKERNAARVVGIDTSPHALGQARFLASWFDQPIELYALSTYDVEQLQTHFDCAVFVGGLYHLKHPLYALEKIAAVCRETLLLQTILRGPDGEFEPEADYPVSETSIFDKPNFPRMYFIENAINGDASNWWFATRSCIKAMLRVVGFNAIEEIRNTEVFICHKPPDETPAPALASSADANVAKVKEFWGNESFWADPNIVHWTQHPKVRERLERFASGEPGKDRFQYFIHRYCRDHMPFERVITLGCGRGELERGLAKYKFALAHDAVDLADAMIEDATGLARNEGLTHISYKVADLNYIELAPNSYDVVFGVSAVHHVAKLEHLLDQVSRSLKPRGYFFLDEFIGPTQFQWTSEQLNAINDAIADLPDKFKQCVDRTRGIKPPVIRYTIDEMNLTDPSEAIRSAEILPLVSQMFEIVEVRGYGGSLLHLLLEDIAGNFTEANPESMRCLESLFELEDKLIESGKLQHDFAVIIARKR